MPLESDGSLTNSILISRNKHWKYISSYHGPWLQLPIELLESLFLVNTNVPGNLLGQHNHSLASSPRRLRAAQRLDPSNNALVQALVSPNTENRASSPASLPSPIDPTAFRNVIAIRRLVDDAADLAVRAASREPFTAGTFADTISNSSAHLHANTNGLSPYHSLNVGGKGGRGCKGLSQVRQQRLRELAVSKMALAYRIDEVATAVVTMQGASALEDVAAKVLKRNPNFLDAIYVNFFHEKIPSRMLSQSTSTDPLDHLIAQCPSTPEYYRTRGIVKCFKEDFPSALRDFKMALAYARHRREQVSCHEETKTGSEYTNPARSVIGHGFEDVECAGTETQIFFFRAACFLQYAVSLIERVMQGVEHEHARVQAENQPEAESTESNEPPTKEALEGKDEPSSNLEKEGERKGKKKSSDRNPKIRATTENFLNPRITYARLLPSASYREALAPLAPQIANLARRAARDYEHFLRLFPSTRGVPPVVTLSGLGTRLSPVSPVCETVVAQHSCSCTGGKCVPGNCPSLEETRTDPIDGSTVTKCGGNTQNSSTNNQSYDFATYHPLLVESYHGCLLAHCLLAADGDAPDFLRLWHQGSHRLENATEGYPVFLAARSMAQADYLEVLERTRKWSGKNATRDMENVAFSTAVDKGCDTDRKPNGWWKWWTEDETVLNFTGKSPVQHGIENGVTSCPDSTAKATSLTTVSRKQPTPPTASANGSSVLRKYPMHTARADTIIVWLQAVAVPAWIERQAGILGQEETMQDIAKKKTSPKRKKRRPKKVEEVVAEEEEEK